MRRRQKYSFRHSAHLAASNREIHSSKAGSVIKCSAANRFFLCRREGIEILAIKPCIYIALCISRPTGVPTHKDWITLTNQKRTSCPVQLALIVMLGDNELHDVAPLVHKHRLALRNIGKIIFSGDERTAGRIATSRSSNNSCAGGVPFDLTGGLSLCIGKHMEGNDAFWRCRPTDFRRILGSGGKDSGDHYRLSPLECLVGFVYSQRLNICHHISFKFAFKASIVGIRHIC